MSDNIYPTGINTTTGLSETADTAYSGIAGDFVSVIDGVSGGIAQTIQTPTAAAGQLSLTLNNTTATGTSVFGVQDGTPSLVMTAYGESHATAPGRTLLTSISNPGIGLRIHSVDTSVAAAPIELRSGSVDVGRWVSGGADPLAITPTALAANTNNYNPTGYAAEVWYISADAPRDLTGIVAPTSPYQKRVTLVNVGANTITLKHNTTSTAANRFYFSTGVDVSLPIYSQVTLVYNTSAGVDLWLEESANLAVNAATAATAGDLAYVQLDGGPTGSQDINLDSNQTHELQIRNDNAGNAAASVLKADADVASISMYALSSGYVTAAEQSTAKITASTGANGMIIENAATRPILFKISTVELGRFNTMGWAWGDVTQAITAVGDTILPTAPVMLLNPDGNYTLTSTPTITAGTKIGQELTLMTPSGEANTVTVQDVGGLAGSTLELGAATRVIGDLKVLRLIWNGAKWLEVSYANN